MLGHIAMSEAVKLNVKSQDHLNGNKSLYAHKARRKKIALIAIEVANGHSEDVRLELGATKLVTGQRSYSAEPPKVIIRKLSEFTWDFLLFAILAFDPVLLALDVFFLLTGPLYNRRLKRQLHSLSDGEMILIPGESKKAILGFRGVSKGTTQLQLWYRCGEGKRQQIECEIR